MTMVTVGIIQNIQGAFNMDYITVKKPVSIRLMKEVVLFHTGIEYNKQNTWTDLGSIYKLCMRELNQRAR